MGIYPYESFSEVKKVEIVILALILIGAGLLRFPLIAQGFFAFTYDQGRDLLEVAKIVNDFNLTLIGPTTGLPGIFYGPWWYYFLSPIFFISGGNPLAITLIISAIGEITIVLLYLLSKKITKNIPVSLGVAAIAAMSQPFITSSSQIWSPSLVLPLMLSYVFLLFKIFEKQKPLLFLLLGLVCGLILDSGAAFGVVLTSSTIVGAVVFRKYFSLKNYFFLLSGLLVVLSPRIIFDLRHELLITKSILSWLTSPNIYQEKLSIGERFLNRLDIFWLQFAQTFTQSKKILSLIPLFVMVTFAFLRIKALLKIDLFRFLLIVVTLLYLLFSLYPDAVWDYYLVGLPLILITIAALILSSLPKKQTKLLILAILIILALNINPKITDPFSITWQGDGAIFRNQTAVLSKLAPQLSGDYSLYVYTPARYDYPFDYLIDYWARLGKLELPKENQRKFYLIIRDDSGHSYLSSGWYGDKVRDQDSLRLKEDFPGNIITELHEAPL